MTHLPAQAVLLVAEQAEHSVDALKRLQHHTVLHALLHRRLYAAISLPYLTGYLAHSPDVDAAEENEDGQHEGNRQGEHGVHTK